MEDEKQIMEILIEMKSDMKEVKQQLGSVENRIDSVENRLSSLEEGQKELRKEVSASFDRLENKNKEVIAILERMLKK